MSPSKQANSVEDAGLQQQNQQQSQQNKFTELLQKTVKDFSKWSTTKQMAAVSIVGAGFFTVLPVLLVASPFIATGAVVGLTLFFTVNAVSYAFKGLKWTGKKAKDGFKYVAKETVKGYKHSMDSLKSGANRTLNATKSGMSRAANATADKLYRLAGETNYLDEIKKFTPEELKKANDVKKDMKGIFADEENNSGLVKSILSEIRSKIIPQIDSKINESKDLLESMKKIRSEEGVQEWTENIEKLEGQKKFVNRLSAGNLNTLTTQRSLSKDNYYLDRTFSEYHDEIKDVIREEKFHASVRHNNTAAKTRGRSKSAPAQPTSSLSESSSSNSLNSVSTDGSEAELLSPKKHKKMKRLSRFSWPIRGKSAKEKTTEIGYQIFSESSPVKTATIGANRNPSQACGPIPVIPPKPPRVAVTRSDSSGNLNSSMNYPEGLNPFAETVPTRPDFVTNIGDEPLRTRSNSSVSLASTSSFVSTSSRLSDSESANSFSFSRTPTSPAQSFEAWSEENKQCRNSSPSIDSGVSSAGSSNGRNSPNPSIKHSAPQVPVKITELLERKNSLKNTGSLKKLVPPKGQMNIPQVHHPASKAQDVPSTSSRCVLQ